MCPHISTPMELSKKRTQILEKNILHLLELMSKDVILYYDGFKVTDIKCQLYNTFYLKFICTDKEIDITEKLNSLTKAELQQFFNNLYVQPPIIPLFRLKY